MFLEHFAPLVAAAFLAGFIDAIAGGDGGLIVIPALRMSGRDPLTGLGANKPQSSFGAGSASFACASKGAIVRSLLVVTCPALAAKLLPG